MNKDEQNEYVCSKQNKYYVMNQHNNDINEFKYFQISIGHDIRHHMIPLK